MQTTVVVYLVTVKCISVVNHYYLCFMWLITCSNYQPCSHFYNLWTQSTLRPTLYRKTGNYIHSGNTTQIYTDRVTAQPQSHAHYYIWSACCIYSSTKSKYSSSMEFFQFSRPHNSKRLDCLYSMLEPCILSVVWTLEKPST